MAVAKTIVKRLELHIVRDADDELEAEFRDESGGHVSATINVVWELVD